MWILSGLSSFAKSALAIELHGGFGLGSLMMMQRDGQVAAWT
jgi:hypothetical protein